MQHSFVALLLVAAVALSAPLMFAALGEVISETAGVLNINLEGMMLFGAFAGVLATYATKSVPLGFVAAALGGALLAWIHGVICFVFRGNQVVSGVVLNIFALGVTSFLLTTVLAPRVSQSIASVPRIKIPLLSDIPIVGQGFFNQDFMVYVAFLLVPAVWWLLNRSTTGLALKAAGERPNAAESLGVNVGRVRWGALMVCGLLAGVGGGQLALAGIGFFTQNMTAGRGFIALAAVVFGRWRAGGVAVAVLVFAIADAFQARAGGLGIHLPYQFLVMLPYLVTLLAVAGLMRGVRGPAFLSVNYHTD
ncbi:MAG: ral nucleoside transport system permease protein [Solirubrobacteraceae bacterium]|jgi:simple sugar transport system permease protein|nr:ral nucleoside transport system permease protein [Solirubrobacteraceae bacterium]